MNAEETSKECERRPVSKSPIVVPKLSPVFAFRRASYLAFEGIRGLLFAPGQTIACIVSLAIVSCLVTLFVCFGSMAMDVLGRAVERARIVVYLKEGVSTPDIESLKKNIERGIGVEHVEYLSREQDRARNASLLPHDVVSRLPQDAIPGQHCLEVTVKTDSGVSIEDVASYLRTLEGVDLVSEPPIGTVRIRSAAAAVAFARVVLTVLGAILFLSTIFFVVGTLNRSIERRREEMTILKLVGATDGFVRAPLYVQGIIQGVVGVLAGTVIALFIIEATNTYLSTGLGVGVRIPSYPKTTLFLGISIGAIVGFVGTTIASMRRIP